MIISLKNIVYQSASLQICSALYDYYTVVFAGEIYLIFGFIWNQTNSLQHFVCVYVHVGKWTTGMSKLTCWIDIVADQNIYKWITLSYIKPDLSQILQNQVYYKMAVPDQSMDSPFPWRTTCNWKNSATNHLKFRPKILNNKVLSSANWTRLITSEKTHGILT